MTKIAVFEDLRVTPATMLLRMKGGSYQAAVNIGAPRFDTPEQLGPGVGKRSRSM